MQIRRGVTTLVHLMGQRSVEYSSISISVWNSSTPSRPPTRRNAPLGD